MKAPVVLLVEDNPITRKLVRFALQQEDIDLIEAVDGHSAIETVTVRRPDLILQDLLLPDMDGFALVSMLRDQPRLKVVPILAFSGLLSQLDEKRIAGAGFTDVVTKPIEPSKLVRLIRAHLPTADAPSNVFGNGRRIVLVDDDDVQRKLSVFRLTRLGFDVVDAGDGHAALAAAKAATPAAIITDAMMPGLDGFGLCAAVRQDPALKHVPIVMLTSTYVDEADRELSRLAGANAFVIRTPALAEMITALQSVLDPSAPVPAPPVQPPDFERERASRTMVQLERQAAAASSARQECAMLSAELAVLNAISEAITQDTDIDVVLKEILAACCDSGGVSLGALYLSNDDGSFRTLLVGSHAGWENGSADQFLDDGDRLRLVMQQRKAVRLSRESATGSESEWLNRSGLQSALIVPLQHKDDTLGAMVMMSEVVDLGADDRLLFAEAVGHQVSVALALTQAFEDTALAAQSAREHARLLESVFSTISDPIMVVDAEGRATTWNAAAEQLIKVSGPDDLALRDPDLPARSGIFHADRTTLMEGDQLPLTRALRGEDVDDADLYIQNELKPDGAWIKVTARPLRDDHGAVTGAVGVSRDVTKERLANEHLMIADRMASIGMMAAGVGHEINNPLSAVVANLEMASAEVAALVQEIGHDKLGDLDHEIRDAYEAAQRVRSIALDLKVFSSGQADQLQPIDVERVLDSAIRMGWNQVRHRAQLVKNYGQVPQVMGSEARLGQVFLNLIVNAAQAIPAGDAESNEIRLRTQVKDGRIVIDVEDTGSGIAPSVMSQLFTPFVTTKPVGIGTGLGLSICQRLVNAMGGTIWAESTAGRGTVFHVALQPADAVPASVATTAARTMDPAPAATARILIVDDEEMLGTILRRLFKTHDVTVLTNAREALERIDAGTHYDAILCDVMMPIMTGIEFHRALTERHPALVPSLIFLTGGAFNKETAAFLSSVPNTRVEKPFDAARLRGLVEAHLASRTAPPHEAA